MKKAVPPTGSPSRPASMSSRAVWCAAAEEGVGRAADPQALRAPASPASDARLGEVDAERLLGIDVLAGARSPAG